MKANKTNWPKHILQWVSLALLIFFLSGLAGMIFTKMEPADPERFCPFGGLQALATFFAEGSLPCSMTSLQILMGIALAAGVIFFSKLFCAYLCPVGTVEDLLSKLRNALCLKPLKPGRKLDRILRALKYALLFWIVYMTVTSSELFCKNLDPYYAAATGFKGEITLWMSLISISLVLLLGLVIDRFWCRYICPLGAISNTLKFWLPLAGMVLVFWGLSLLGVHFSWVWCLAAFCLGGYLLEIFNGQPKLQVMHIIKDDDACSHCSLCNKSCPYGIDVASASGRVTDVDCALCGECVYACKREALRFGFAAAKGRCSWTRWLPALVTVLLVALALFASRKFELPTINEVWDVRNGMQLETLRMDNLRSVKCYGSSMAFKARMEQVRGVHGVKTYVGSHSVVISYDPSVTNADKIRETVFIPSRFCVLTPDPSKLSELKCVIIRTEKMYDKLDLEYLGLQLRQTGRDIYGVESEYDCPLVIKVYMSPDENLDEDWFRELVEKKELEMTLPGGGTKDFPVDFEFIRMEKGETRVGVAEYIKMMFDPFTAEVKGRNEHYKGQTQYIYEMVDRSFDDPLVKRALPYLNNYLSKEEGFMGLYLKLNKDLLPSLQFRYASPLGPDRIWELITMDKWTVTYKNGEVRDVDAMLKFVNPGVVHPYEDEERQ